MRYSLKKYIMILNISKLLFNLMNLIVYCTNKDYLIMSNIDFILSNWNNVTFKMQIRHFRNKINTHIILQEEIDILTLERLSRLCSSNLIYREIRKHLKILLFKICEHLLHDNHEKTTTKNIISFFPLCA